MSGSLVDMLAPEMRSAVGFVSIGVVILGAVIWAAGLRVARIFVAVLVGLVAAAIAAWLLPPVLGVAMATAALVGFVVGALAGALGFRLLQGLTLAVCLGLAVVGTYYRWHVQPAAPPTTISAIAASEPASVPASALLVEGPLAEPPASAATTAAATSAAHRAGAFGRKLVDLWNAVDRKDQRRMLAAGIGTAAVVLLLAFGFARQTTLIVSAILGTLMMLGGADAGTHVFMPAWNATLPSAILSRLAIPAGIAIVGMLIQWWLFWPRKKKSVAGTPANEPPVPGHPPTGMGRG